jgi:hypothetical protein
MSVLEEDTHSDWEVKARTYFFDIRWSEINRDTFCREFGSD